MAAERASLRVGDRDRENVSEILREAAGEGRLSISELEERLELAYAARTCSDLDALVCDLPRASATPMGLAPTNEAVTIRAGFDSERRQGRWQVPAQLVVRAHLGSVKLDFTQAVVAHRQIHLDIRSDAGSIVLVVPAGWLVDTDRVVKGLGSVRNRVPAPYSPEVTVLVTGLTAVGGLTARPPRRYQWRWLGGA